MTAPNANEGDLIHDVDWNLITDQVNSVSSSIYSSRSERDRMYAIVTDSTIGNANLNTRINALEMRKRRIRGPMAVVAIQQGVIGADAGYEDPGSIPEAFQTHPLYDKVKRKIVTDRDGMWNVSFTLTGYLPGNAPAAPTVVRALPYFSPAQTHGCVPGMNLDAWAIGGAAGSSVVLETGTYLVGLKKGTALGMKCNNTALLVSAPDANSFPIRSWTTLEFVSPLP